MSTPLVSVIVLNYNGENYLKNCFESLGSQTYENYEVIMVDNASEDDSIEYVKGNFPWVKVIRNEKNLGFAAGNNWGIREARGDIIALLNNDTIADSEWLEESVRTFEQSENIGITQGKIYSYDEPSKHVSYSYKFFPSYKMPWVTVSNVKNESSAKEVDVVSGAAMVFKREILDKIGFLDEGYFFYFEDLDFCLRAKKAGYGIVYNPRAVILHKGNGTPDRRRTELVFRSMFYFIVKHLPLWQIIPFIFFFIFILVPYHVIRSRGENTLPRIKGFMSALKHLRDLRNKV